MYDKPSQFPGVPAEPPAEKREEAAFYFSQIQKDLQPQTTGGGQGAAFTEMLGRAPTEKKREEKERDLLLLFTEWIADRVDVDVENIADEIRDLFLGKIPESTHAQLLTEWFAAFLNDQHISLREYLG